MVVERDPLPLIWYPTIWDIDHQDYHHEIAKRAREYLCPPPENLWYATRPHPVFGNLVAIKRVDLPPWHPDSNRPLGAPGHDAEKSEYCENTLSRDPHTQWIPSDFHLARDNDGKQYARHNKIKSFHYKGELGYLAGPTLFDLLVVPNENGENQGQSLIHRVLLPDKSVRYLNPRINPKTYNQILRPLDFVAPRVLTLKQIEGSFFSVGTQTTEDKTSSGCQTDLTINRLSLLNEEDVKAANIATEMSTWCTPLGYPRPAPAIEGSSSPEPVIPSVIPVRLDLHSLDYHPLVPSDLLSVVTSGVYPFTLRRKRALPMPSFVPPNLTQRPAPRATEVMTPQPDVQWIKGLEWSRMNPALFSYLVVPEDLLPTVEVINTMVNVPDVDFAQHSRSATEIIWKRFEAAVSRMWGNAVAFRPAIAGASQLGPLDKSSPGAVLIQVRPASYYLVLALIEGMLHFRGEVYTAPEFWDYVRCSILVAMFFRLLALGVGDKLDTHLWNGFPLPNGLWMAPDDHRKLGHMYTL
jgi:hypothetical protein